MKEDIEKDEMDVRAGREGELKYIEYRNQIIK